MNVHKTGSYPCDECDKVCKSESSLYAHKYTVHRKHEKEKTFACLECGKMFVLQSDLNVHHRIWFRFPYIFSLQRNSEYRMTLSGQCMTGVIRYSESRCNWFHFHANLQKAIKLKLRILWLEVCKMKGHKRLFVFVRVRVLLVGAAGVFDLLPAHHANRHFGN